MEEERQAAPDNAGTGSDAAQTSPDDVEPSKPVPVAGPVVGSARPISVVPGVAAARASVPGALRPNPGAVRAGTWPSGESKIYGARPAASAVGESGTKRITGTAKVPLDDFAHPNGHGGGLASIAQAEEPWPESDEPQPNGVASAAAETAVAESFLAEPSSAVPSSAEPVLPEPPAPELISPEPQPISPEPEPQPRGP